MNANSLLDIKGNIETQPLGHGMEIRARGLNGKNTLDFPIRHASVWGETILGGITGTTLRTLGLSTNYPLPFVSYLSTASQLQISSTSNSDVLVGTGARTVKIAGLDSAWNPISETVIMLGQTPVLTVRTDWFRINKLTVTTAGSNSNNVGTVYLCQVGEAYSAQFHPTATNYCNILPAKLYSTVFSYSIPSGKNWEYVKGNFFTDWTDTKPGILQEYYRDESSGSMLTSHTNLYITGNVSYGFEGAVGWYGKVTVEVRVQNEVNGTNSCTVYYEYVEY